MRVPEKEEVVGGVRGSQIESVYWEDVQSKAAYIEHAGEANTPPQPPLPHHQLVIMKAGSLVRRRVINAKTDR